LADEPTGNLDSRTSVEIMAIFQQLNDDGITVVMVTHESDIAAYAKRNVFMRDGVVLNDLVVNDRRNAADELRGRNDDEANQNYVAAVCGRRNRITPAVEDYPYTKI
jgi:putative ABC transport system ATP-binding protein